MVPRVTFWPVMATVGLVVRMATAALVGSMVAARAVRSREVPRTNLLVVLAPAGA
jgi:uncharacterized membrane protein